MYLHYCSPEVFGKIPRKSFTFGPSWSDPSVFF